jgi:hypothetical protein
MFEELPKQKAEMKKLRMWNKDPTWNQFTRSDVYSEVQPLLSSALTKESPIASIISDFPLPAETSHIPKGDLITF